CVDRNIDTNKIGDCWCSELCRRWGDGAKNFTALYSGGLGLRLCRLGMERTTALGCIGLCCESAECAVIGNRDPGKDRYRDDQATRGCFHVASIADSWRMLKCYLFDP